MDVVRFRPAWACREERDVRFERFGRRRMIREKRVSAAAYRWREREREEREYL
jgi:hypothetical protein